jgi:elongation factor 4
MGVHNVRTTLIIIDVGRLRNRLMSKPMFRLYSDKRSSKQTSKVEANRSNFSVDLSVYPPNRIRNFCIIAHVDHGKSTLADRMLEFTGTISKNTKNEQVLDRLQVERERGITVKAQSAAMFYQHKGESYLLNLIDTPGHVDFHFEVSRSLRACQGAILLVDANQGVQAQTVANFYSAFELGLTVIPVLNKIDLKNSKPKEVGLQMSKLFDIKPDEILKVSAKLGIGVQELIAAIVDRIPPPPSDSLQSLSALLFDSWYTRYRGVGCSVAIVNGSLKKGDRIVMIHSKKSYEVAELGIMHPEEVVTSVLHAGQVGYMYANLKSTREVTVGDTVHLLNHPVSALPGFRAAKPMVFAGLFPNDQSEYGDLKRAIEKLALNDSSVTIGADSSAALGQGWRLGFLGMLHMDVFCERLEQEYATTVVLTTPNVPYRVKIHGDKNIQYYGGEEVTILNPCHMPDPAVITEYSEPMVTSTIIIPDNCVGDVLSLIRERRGDSCQQTSLNDGRIMFNVSFPLNEIIVDFFDHLKSITSGYGSFDYEDAGYKVTNLARLDIFLNGQLVEEMTHIVHVSHARQAAKRIAAKLKESIPQQLFEIAIQIKVGGKVLARDDIKALRKDVTAKLYGGDVTRRMKLLRRQTEGKKRMRSIGRIEVPKDVFITVLKR